MAEAKRMTNEEKQSTADLMQIIKGMSPESIKMCTKVARQIVFVEGLRNECK